MSNLTSSNGIQTKVTAVHLARDAFLYVRQSTLHQVLQNNESTQRQYALQQQAIALGWPSERVHTIDCDLGHSGASSADRAGFQQLVSEVSLGHAGVVLGLEVSRLARNSADWQRLLELCALTDTLILDEDGLYDCNDFNDRLLLGLKGTLSEAELHFLRARMRGGLLNKARRGELACSLPVGLRYDERKQICLDPDQQVQQAIRLLFDTFQRLGTGHGIVVHFRQAGLLFPRCIRSGTHKGEIVWGELTLNHVLRVLHNPRYAGAFCFGRTRTRTWPDGSHHIRRLAQEEWLCLIPNLHAGYISWEMFQDNQRRLQECSQAHGKDRRQSPPREGSALLQGLVVCGVCGRRMTVRYHQRQGNLFPDYVCQRENVDRAAPRCQHLPGHAVDAAITQLLLQKLTSLELSVSIAVQEEMVAREVDANALRAKQVTRAQYEADLAGQRYRRVDPNNRLVASSLEAEWNAALRALQDAQQEAERQLQKGQLQMDDAVRAEILALSNDFPSVWNDPHTTQHDRKRLVRFLIENVTITKAQGVNIQVRFRGGATQTLTLSAPQRSWEIWETSQKVVAMVDVLLNEYTDQQIAEILNERGMHPGKGGIFRGRLVGNIRRQYDLKNRFERLRARGLLTAQEIAEKLEITWVTVRKWRQAGLLQGYAYDDKNDYLYEPPTENAPTKSMGQKLSKRCRFFQAELGSLCTKKVQYES